MASKLQVSVDEGLHRRLQELQRDASHLFEVTKDGGVPGQAPGEPGDLGDVDRHVGDPLQVQADVEENREQTKVARHRRLERQQFQELLLDPDPVGIDLVVPRDHSIREQGIVQGP